MRDFWRRIRYDTALYVCNEVVAFIPIFAIRRLWYIGVMRFTVPRSARIFMGCRFNAPGGLVLGENSILNRGCRLDTRGGVYVGNNVSISEEVRVLTAEHDPTSDSFVTKKTAMFIEDFSFIGTGSMLLPGARMGLGSILGAGSVSKKNIPTLEVWVGNPATKIGTRTGRLNYRTSYNRYFQ